MLRSVRRFPRRQRGRNMKELRNCLTQQSTRLACDAGRFISGPKPDSQTTASFCKSVQAELSRWTWYYGRPGGSGNLRLMRLIDEAYLKMSWYGPRRMVRHLFDGWVNRCRVRRMIRLMALRSVALRLSMAGGRGRRHGRGNRGAARSGGGDAGGGAGALSGPFRLLTGLNPKRS